MSLLNPGEQILQMKASLVVQLVEASHLRNCSVGLRFHFVPVVEHTELKQWMKESKEERAGDYAGLMVQSCCEQACERKMA